MGAGLKKYSWLVSLFLVLLVSYQLAKLTNLFLADTFFPGEFVKTITPTGRQTVVVKEPSSDIDVLSIIKRNFFDEKETVWNDGGGTDIPEITIPVTKETETKTPDNQVAVKTSLPIKLISTLSTGDGTSSENSAVIEANKKSATYFVDSPDTFAPGVKVVRILYGRVEFLNKGRLEYIDIEDFDEGNPKSMNSLKTTKSSAQ